MSSFHKRAKDLQRCLRSLHSFSDGQAQISSWDEELVKWVKIAIIPNDGAYRNGKFYFEIIFPEGYPNSPPNVMCTSSIYHPNIDVTGDEYNVCLNLFDEWQTTYGIEDCVQGILFLLYNPNLEDPLSPFFSPDMTECDFLENVKNSLKGGEIDDFDYPANNVNEDEGGNNQDEVEDEELVLAKVEKLVEASQEEEATDDDDDDDDEEENAKENEDKSPVIINSTTECSGHEVTSSDKFIDSLTKSSQHGSGCLSIHLDPVLAVASLGIYYLVKVIYKRVNQSRTTSLFTSQS